MHFVSVLYRVFETHAILGVNVVKSLLDTLTSGKPLVADGATGTVLMAAGLQPGTLPELWNVEQPEKILALHRAYIEAGSQIILTNTFGGSRLKLSKGGLGDRVHELNLAGVSLAKQAAVGQSYVAGDIGPTGEMMKPYGTLSYEQAQDVFAEQAAALVEGGVDALWVETMADINEAKAAVTAALRAAQAAGIPDLPVFCSLTFGKKARTMMGVSPRQAVQELWPLGVAAIGANCGEGLEMIPEVLRQMRAAAPEARLIAKPNAGLPRLVNGETIYDVPPDVFAAHLAEFISLGAQVVGSCCGSSPEYIRAIAASLE
jgi:5-methyltetrahydrofolate--homocysteine methyltransferase